MPLSKLSADCDAEEKKVVRILEVNNQFPSVLSAATQKRSRTVLPADKAITDRRYLMNYGYNNNGENIAPKSI